MPDIFDSISTSKGDIFDNIAPQEDIFDKIKGIWNRGVEASGAESEMMGSPANLETLRTVIGGGAAWIPAGIMQAATVGEQGGVSEFGEQLAGQVQEKIVGKPSTDVGRLTQKQISAPFEKLSEKSQEYGDIVYDKTGSPILATATRVAGESLPFVLPFVAGKGLKASVKAGKRVIEPPSIELGEVNKVPTSITPEVGRSERVSPEFIKSVLTEKKQPLKIEQKKDWVFADKDSELIERQADMFEKSRTGKKTVKTKEQPKEPEIEAEKRIAPAEKVEPTQISQAEQVAKPTEMPVDGKPAKAAVDINKDLVEKGFEGLPDNELARYNPIQKVEEVSKAQALVGNPDFFEMAKGNVPLPQDVHPQVLFNVAINEATKAGNIDMLMDLAKSPIAEQRSLAAQQLGASAWEKPTNNIVKAIQEVKKGRETKVRNPQIKEKVRRVLNEEVKKINLSKEELSWDRFLDKIAC